MNPFDIGLFVGLIVSNYFRKNTLLLYHRLSGIYKSLALAPIVVIMLLIGNLEFGKIILMSPFFHFITGIIMGFSMHLAIVLILNFKKST